MITLFALCLLSWSTGTLLLASVPSCDELSTICMQKNTSHIIICIPYYLKRSICTHSLPSLYDLLNDEKIVISSYTSLSFEFLQHIERNETNQCPNVIAIHCYESFSTYLLPLLSTKFYLHSNKMNPCNLIQFKTQSLKTEAISGIIIHSFTLNDSQTSKFEDIMYTVIVVIFLIITVGYYFHLFLAHYSISISTIRNYFLRRKHTSKLINTHDWKLEGGSNGLWTRQKKEKWKDHYVIYYSDSSNQLLWLPAYSYPGVSALRVNIPALYHDVLSNKLNWFYSQLEQLTTDKRIRIILNRKTILHDTLLAFATLTSEDMNKQIRLQFNGEPGIDAGGLSREWMALLVRNIFTTNSSNSTDKTKSEESIEEERFVMRIDHLTPSDDCQNNVHYFKDTSFSSHDFNNLFIFTSHGYLPNPAFNYNLKSSIRQDYKDQLYGDLLHSECTSECLHGDMRKSECTGECLHGDLLHSECTGECFHGDLLHSECTSECLHGDLLHSECTNECSHDNTAHSECIDKHSHDNATYSEYIGECPHDNTTYSEYTNKPSHNNSTHSEYTNNPSHNNSTHSENTNKPSHNNSTHSEYTNKPSHNNSTHSNHILNPSQSKYIHSDHFTELSLDEMTQPECASETIARNFHFVGRLIGRAIFDGIPLGISLNPLIIKAILSIPLSMNDIRIVNEDIYKSLHFIKSSLQTDPSLEDVLDLYFSVDITNSIDGENIIHEEVNLIKGGKQRRVSSENVGEYNDLLIKHYLYDDYKNTLYFLLSGLYEVIPQDYLAIFTEEELTKILEGEKKDWRKHTVYTNEFYDHHPVVDDFWSIITNWTTQQQSLLLSFSTGYSFPPIMGFSHLKGPDGRTIPFCLSPLSITNQHISTPSLLHYQIRSHTCFHKLEIPIVDREHLEKILLSTIQSDNGCFGFDEE